MANVNEVAAWLRQKDVQIEKLESRIAMYERLLSDVSNAMVVLAPILNGLKTLNDTANAFADLTRE